MANYPEPLSLNRVRVFPLAAKESLNWLEKVLVDPDAPAPPCPAQLLPSVEQCVARIRRARESGASVILMYGAHLVKNGAMAIVNSLIEQGWVTHVATNGAGTIHDWEFAFIGKTEESVRKNVAMGSFGTWDETGRYIQLALLAGALKG